MYCLLNLELINHLPKIKEYNYLEYTRKHTVKVVKWSVPGLIRIRFREYSSVLFRCLCYLC